MGIMTNYIEILYVTTDTYIFMITFKFVQLRAASLPGIFILKVKVSPLLLFKFTQFLFTSKPGKEPAIKYLHVLSLGAAVLRIPVLYGEVEKLEESAVTVMFDKVQFSNKSANMDHWQQRFPTHVKDVASVCRQLAEKRMLVSLGKDGA